MSFKALLNHPNNLVQRCTTAFLLGGAAIAMAFHPFLFAVLCLTISAFALHEWYALVDRDNKINHLRYTAFSLIVIVFPMVVSSHFSIVIGLLALLLMGTTFFLFLLLKNTKRHAFVLALGIPYIGVPMNMMVWMRSDYDIGVLLVLFVFAATWLSDSLAYFVGKRVGGPKLAPRISPNKTWSGFFGACCGSLFAGVIFSVLGYFVRDDSLLTHVNLFDYKFYMLAIFSFVLGAIAQAGDLLESMVKRYYKIKDSGNILPGHGGILDRIDALLFVAVFVAFAHYFIMNFAQASAML